MTVLRGSGASATASMTSGSDDAPTASCADTDARVSRLSMVICFSSGMRYPRRSMSERWFA